MLTGTDHVGFVVDSVEEHAAGEAPFFEQLRGVGEIHDAAAGAAEFDAVALTDVLAVGDDDIVSVCLKGSVQRLADEFGMRAAGMEEIGAVEDHF